MLLVKNMSLFGNIFYSCFFFVFDSYILQLYNVYGGVISGLNSGCLKLSSSKSDDAFNVELGKFIFKFFKPGPARRRKKKEPSQNTTNSTLGKIYWSRTKNKYNTIIFLSFCLLL